MDLNLAGIALTTLLLACQIAGAAYLYRAAGRRAEVGGGDRPPTEDYLRRLNRATRVLPKAQRGALLAEIRAHLAAGLPPNPTQAEVRSLLDEVGTPAEIVAAAQPDRPRGNRGARELLALILMVIGFSPYAVFVLFLIPLGIGGLALLLWSPLWSVRQKVLAAVIWPGALVAKEILLYLGPLYTDTFVPWVISIVVQLAIAGYLYWAAGRRARAAA